VAVHRITTAKKDLEAEIQSQDYTLLEMWMKLSKKELESRIRHSKEEETYRLQGALRILDDLGEILKR